MVPTDHRICDARLRAAPETSVYAAWKPNLADRASARGLPANHIRAQAELHSEPLMTAVE